MNHSISIKKSSILLCVLALLMTFLVAQEGMAQYHPFPIENGIWMNNHSDYYVDENFQAIITSSFDYKYCANGIDTIINSITYKQVDYCSTSGFHGAWRYDNGQVYFVPKDSLNEFLLYDFTLNAGNTVEIILQGGPGQGGGFQIYETYISYVDTVIVNGTPRRRLFTEGYDWIEGIGCTTGLFMEPWINVSNYFRSLVCMSTNDTLHYHNGILEIGEPGVCDFTVSVEDPDLYLENVEVFPNPTSGKVFIRMNGEVQSGNAILTNALGQKLANYSFTGADQFEIEIQGNAGLYFLEILTANGEKSVLKILKQ